MLATMEPKLTKATLYRMTRDLMDHHGLQHWEVRIGSAKRVAGTCNYRKRLITVSFDIHKEWPEEQTRDTILHEIAHALTPRDKGHGADWKAKCVEIGANPKRTYDSVNLPTPQGTWIQSCECGHDRSRRAHRRKANVAFSNCGHPVLYRKEGEPASAARAFRGSEAVGSREWAKARTLEMGGSVEYDVLLHAPKGMVWAMTETHYIDLTLGTYTDYDQSVKDAREAVRDDVNQGFHECGCDYMCKDEG